jgi:hypothetical protein
VKEDECSGNIMYSCMKLEKKLRPVETNLGMREGRKGE